ncbi:hypothetical protein LUZ60_001807 [Juncus effusus]|nr:hypothetical protein LUZ60_001807 [Juncus effusus]
MVVSAVGDSDEDSIPDCEHHHTVHTEGNKEEPHSGVLSDTDPIIEPKVGMIFNGRDEADALWKLYGLRMGFSTQRRSLHRFSGEPYSCLFICSRGRTPANQQTKKDPQNQETQPLRGALKLKGRDGNALMQYFIRRKAESSNFFYQCEFDMQGRLSKIFWATTCCRAAYRHFGDVVTFDTTYLTNKPYVGVNQHVQSILLGCCLLPDETTETFVWVMKTWLTCMGGRAPRGIITDQCAAMANAIQQVLPNTHHRLCLWHIMQKIPQKVGQGARRKARISRVKHVVYNSYSTSEFEEKWQLIIDEFPIGV